MIKYFFAILFILLFPQPGYSLKCSIHIPTKQNIDNLYKGAAAIFSGEVIDSYNVPNSTCDDKVVTFQVDKVWKGIFGQQIKTITQNDCSSMWKPTLKTDTPYLVFAYKNPELGYIIGVCSYTKLKRKGTEKIILRLNELKNTIPFSELLQ